MLEQDLKEMWSKSSQSTRIVIDPNGLREELMLKLKDLKRKIKRRDQREIAASVFGMLLFTFLTYEIPFILCKVACMLSIGWFLYVILKLRVSKRQNTKIDFSLPMAIQLQEQKVFMRRQADILDSIMYWYAIPPFIINILFIVGLGDPLAYDWSNYLAELVLPLSANFKIFLVLGLSVFYAFIIWMNKKALSNEIKPILNKLDDLIFQLSKDEIQR
jgi:hypothetical protein